MRHYHRLAEDDRLKRRTVADALEVLRSVPEFTDGTRTQVVITPLRLPDGQCVGLVDLEFEAGDDLIFVVSLPSSAKFRAIHETTCWPDRFEISMLGATADSTAKVRLRDGPVLRAVEMTSLRACCRAAKGLPDPSIGSPHSKLKGLSLRLSGNE